MSDSSPPATTSTTKSSSSSSSWSLLVLDRAQDLRQQGNHLFRQQSEYRGALSFYTKALEVLLQGGEQEVGVAGSTFKGAGDASSSLSTTEQQQQLGQLRDELILNYCNRSACYLVLGELELAREDALRAWDDLSQKTSVKAAYRLAKAYVALTDYSAAKDLIQYVTSSSSNATPINLQLTMEETKSFEDMWNQILQLTLTTTTTLSSSSQSNNNNNSNNRVEKEDETSIRYVKRPLSIREFTVKESLGYGNFSEIHVVVHKSTAERFALKKIVKKQAADLAKRQHPNVYNEIQMERRVLLERLPAATCSFVITMFHAFQDYETLYYLMELHDQWTDLWTQLRWKKKKTTNVHNHNNNNNNNNDLPNDDSNNMHTKMVGCHRSQASVWLYQMVLALEHLHSHGIVHRDIKAENILLNRRGHVVLIDFGTAKDLIQTDLNGPEFVGTPDFMSPEAVTGDSSMKSVSSNNKKKKNKKNKNDDENKHDDDDDDDKEEEDTSRHGKATCNADLWALGALGYIMQTGMTPFWTTSPYLAFLRIQRGLLTRPTGIIDDDCWDWIRQLLQVEPKKRLGADTYVVVTNPQEEEQKQQDDQGSASATSTTTTGMIRRMKERTVGKGYAAIKEHPYLAKVHQQYMNSPEYRRQSPIPSLRDLCYRAVADIALQECQDMDLCEAHPPGDGSSHDLLRLSTVDRNAVLHLLDRQQLLQTEPRLWSRFFTSNIEARLTAKIRPETRDVVGWTKMNDDQGKAPNANAQQFEKPKQMEPLEFVQLCSPLFIAATTTTYSSTTTTTTTTTTTSNIEQEEERKKAHIKLLRKCIARINKVRPKLVVVCASVDVVHDQVKKLLARINESIPVVYHANDSNNNNNNNNNRAPPPFCTFWMSGIQGLCVSHTLATYKNDGDKNDASIPTTALQRAKTLATTYNMSDDDDDDKNDASVSTATTLRRAKKEQMDWIREQAEICRMSKHPLFCFINGPVHEGFPMYMLKKLARGRTLAVFGPGASSSKKTNHATTTTTTTTEDTNKTRKKQQPDSTILRLNYKANEKVSPKCLWKPSPWMNDNRPLVDDDDDDDNDCCSVKSSDSVEDEGDEFAMVIESTASLETGLRWIRVDPINADEWSFDMEWVE